MVYDEDKDAGVPTKSVVVTKENKSAIIIDIITSRRDWFADIVAIAKNHPEVLISTVYPAAVFETDRPKAEPVNSKPVKSKVNPLPGYEKTTIDDFPDVVKLIQKGQIPEAVLALEDQSGLGIVQIKRAIDEYIAANSI